MPDTSTKAAEKLLEDVFVALLAIADDHGITIKRMAELLPVVQVREMRRQGMSQQEIMAASGYALKTIRKILAGQTLEGNNSPLDRFVGDWNTDPHFPATLPIDGEQFPTFKDVAFRYGKEFRPGALLKILVEQRLVEVSNAVVTLKGRAVLPVSIPRKLDSARVAARCLLQTLSRNTRMEKEEPFLERRFWSHNVPPAKLPALRKEMADFVIKNREQFVQILAAYEEPDSTEIDPAHQSAGIGIYWFEEKG